MTLTSRRFAEEVKPATDPSPTFRRSPLGATRERPLRGVVATPEIDPPQTFPEPDGIVEIFQSPQLIQRDLVWFRQNKVPSTLRK